MYMYSSPSDGHGPRAVFLAQRRRLCARVERLVLVVANPAAHCRAHEASERRRGGLLRGKRGVRGIRANTSSVRLYTPVEGYWSHRA